MGAVRSLALVSAGVVIGGVLLIAHRVSVETGKSMMESFADVPEEAQRMFADVRARADQASAEAREAYYEKQAEMEAILNGGGAGEKGW